MVFALEGCPGVEALPSSEALTLLSSSIASQKRNADTVSKWQLPVLYFSINQTPN